MTEKQDQRIWMKLCFGFETIEMMHKTLSNKLMRKTELKKWQKWLKITFLLTLILVQAMKLTTDNIERIRLEKIVAWKTDHNLGIPKTTL